LLLLEVIVGAADEGLGFSELLSDVGLVLGVPAFDEDSEALGYKLNLMAEAFNQHTGVALQLIKPLIDGSKPLIDRNKLLVM
jgi:hypothetical protein